MSFEKTTETHQLAWRAKNISTKEFGKWMGKPYAHLVPERLWTDGLWMGIRDSLPKYLNCKGIQRHSGSHNLKSSWTMCANLYFPFTVETGRLSLLATFLRNYVVPRLETVDQVELEYEEPRGSGLHPSEMLGETKGSRGSNQTSPDLGIVGTLDTGARVLILVENKLVEKSFYGCSGRKSTDKHGQTNNPQPERCETIQRSPKSYAALCHRSHQKRRYWDILAEVADRDQLAKLKQCPAATAGYQLFRQQALAEGIARSNKYEIVVSAVAYDVRNVTLGNCLRKNTGLEGIESWGRLFEGKTVFSTFTHQAWVNWVQENDVDGRWTDWRQYVTERYQL